MEFIKCFKPNKIKIIITIIIITSLFLFITNHNYKTHTNGSCQIIGKCPGEGESYLEYTSKSMLIVEYEKSILFFLIISLISYSTISIVEYGIKYFKN